MQHCFKCQICMSNHGIDASFFVDWNSLNLDPVIKHLDSMSIQSIVMNGVNSPINQISLLDY